MIQRTCFFWIAGAIAVGAWLMGCNYDRMNNDEAVDLYQQKMPEQPADAVPLDGGLTALKLADPDRLRNPLPERPAAIQRGRAAYQVYCSQCHGPDARGFGTVGQSFAPLPTDLHSGYVQAQSDGKIYARISLGYRRHPPLYSTVSDHDRWALVAFIRSLKSTSQQ